MITVEGMVSVRGNEPFTGLMLVTGDRNTYILTLPDEAAMSAVRRQAPGRFRVSGTPYLGQWQGRERAHLRVLDWTRLDS